MVTDLTDLTIQETNFYIGDAVNIEQSMLNSIVNSALNHTAKPSNAVKIDSLKSLHQELMKYMDSTIKILSAVVEIDKQINLKSKALAYLNRAKEFFSESFQKTIKPFIQESMEVADVQKNTENLSLILTKEDLDLNRLQFMKSVQEFENKYHITDKDRALQ
jgi:hypothetical protein